MKQNNDNRKDKGGCEIREPDADHSAPPDDYLMTAYPG